MLYMDTLKCRLVIMVSKLVLSGDSESVVAGSTCTYPASFSGVPKSANIVKTNCPNVIHKNPTVNLLVKSYNLKT